MRAKTTAKAGGLPGNDWGNEVNDWDEVL